VEWEESGRLAKGEMEMDELSEDLDELMELDLDSGSGIGK